MKMEFEYGQGTISAELPENTDIFIPGETVKDPDYIPEEELEAAYLESLAHPIGMPALSELAHKGSTVTIVVPDRVKGGEQATSHRKLSMRREWRRKMSCSSFQTDCTREARSRMPRPFLARNYLRNFGIQGRLSAMTARMKPTWSTWERRTGVTRCI